MSIRNAVKHSGGSRGGARAPLFWVKKKEVTEGRKADRASKTKPHSPTPLSSRSGSATETNAQSGDLLTHHF